MKEELLEPYLRKLRISKIKEYIPEGGILCDVGCGLNATFLRDISKSIYRGYGFDRKIKDNSFENIYIKSCDIEDCIPLDNDTVDCVTMLAVLEHLKDSKKTLLECHRILRPAGVLILTTPSPLSKPLLEFLSFKLNIVSREEIADHKHYYSKGELLDILSCIGFRGIRCDPFEFGLNNMAIGFK